MVDPSLTRLLSQLVAIPSVNPMGRDLSGPGFLEVGMTDALERYFRDLGVDFQRTTVEPGRDNLLAVYDPPGRSPTCTLLWDAHQDTVPTEGMVIPPFEPRVEGHRLYGRGSCDIKGGMAAMLHAFARLVRERPAGSARVLMACTVDEEFTHRGSSALGAAIALGEVRADLGIVAEPTGLNVVTAHKGAVRWKIRTKGVACHSSTPRLGVNAIYRMARVLDALATHAEELADSRPDPMLGPPSLSVGRIEGGVSVNVVPDLCAIEIDRRVIPGEVAADCPAHVEQFLRERLGTDFMECVERTAPWVLMPALAPGMSGPWVEGLRGAIRDATGRMPDVMGVPYGTDAGPLSQAGLPCVVIGPGDIAQAHTKDEWIDLREVAAAAEAYYLIACSLGAGPSSPG